MNTILVKFSRTNKQMSSDWKLEWAKAVAYISFTKKTSSDALGIVLDGVN